MVLHLPLQSFLFVDISTESGLLINFYLFILSFKLLCLMNLKSEFRCFNTKCFQLIPKNLRNEIRFCSTVILLVTQPWLQVTHSWPKPQNLSQVLLDSSDPDTHIESLMAQVQGVGRTGWVNMHTDKIFESEKVSFYLTECFPAS